MKLLRALLGCSGMLATAFAAPARETVVLLHGLGRTSLSMARLACELRREGYTVLNATYPSRTRSLESLATDWLPGQLRQVAVGSRVHFVTHSMGGIVVRLWLREHGAPVNFGRVVMLAPPNAGSEIPDRFASFAPFQWITGANGRRLGTGVEALPRQLGAWPAEVGDLGIIAGSRTAKPMFASTVPTPHDGKVSVASTHLAGERDHFVLPYSHTWIGWHRATLGQVLAFLSTGQFARQA